MNTTLNACLELNRIFCIYEKASGQSINSRKSYILFNPNLHAEMKDNLGNVLGMSQAEDHSEYLGLPTVVGLNWRDAFKAISKKYGNVCSNGLGICFQKVGKRC